jgi:hypothetical protein
MFNSTTNGVQNTALTLEQILGINAASAELLGGTQWYAGDYGFQVTGIDVNGSYEIKQEDHPFLGSKAPRIELQFTCIATDQASLKGEKGETITKEAAEKLVFAG